MTLSEALASVAGKTFGEGLPVVIQALDTEPLIVPVAEEPEEGSQSYQFFAGTDANGETWYYVYSGLEALDSADLGETHYLEWHIVKLLDIIDRDGTGGVFIDSHIEDQMFPITREYFRGIVDALR